KISRDDILAHAYDQCRSNKGAPGVDGQDFADIEAYGVERWLAELALALRQETYRPEPIRRVFIPKANGKLRPLGISSVRDRVCMTAALLVLEPIFEADLPPEIYAYRAGRNAQQAVVEVEELVFRGHPDVVDADLADYFGSIPQADLLKSVARRIVDRRVLHLIKMWLECPVEETDQRGRTRRTTEARDSRRGIPQGSPLSPLLANLYMRRFVLGWKKLGLEQSLGTRLVTYADDLVILCRQGGAEKALHHLREIMGKLKLTRRKSDVTLGLPVFENIQRIRWGFSGGRIVRFVINFSEFSGIFRRRQRADGDIRAALHKSDALPRDRVDPGRQHRRGDRVCRRAARLCYAAGERHRAQRQPPRCRGVGRRRADRSDGRLSASPAGLAASARGDRAGPCRRRCV